MTRRAMDAHSDRYRVRYRRLRSKVDTFVGNRSSLEAVGEEEGSSVSVAVIDKIDMAGLTDQTDMTDMRSQKGQIEVKETGMTIRIAMTAVRWTGGKSDFHFACRRATSSNCTVLGLCASK